MNREIKFRGKAKDNKWCYGDLLEYPQGEFQIWTKIREDGGHNYTVIPETVGQFTGLYDKRGTEIYEGDIIRATTTHGKVIGEYIVVRSEGLDWNYNGFALKVIGKREYGKFENFHPDNIWWAGDTPANWDEVIGNIYDNPELLNNE